MGTASPRRNGQHRRSPSTLLQYCADSRNGRGRQPGRSTKDSGKRKGRSASTRRLKGGGQAELIWILRSWLASNITQRCTLKQSSRTSVLTSSPACAMINDHVSDEPSATSSATMASTLRSSFNHCYHSSMRRISKRNASSSATQKSTMPTRRGSTISSGTHSCFKRPLVASKLPSSKKSAAIYS